MTAASLESVVRMANDPAGEVNQFREILDEKKWRIVPRRGVAAVVTAIFSAAAFKYSKVVSGISLLATAVVLATSFYRITISKERDRYQQETEIAKFFNPYIRAFNKAFWAKADHIGVALKGRDATNLQSEIARVAQEHQVPGTQAMVESSHKIMAYAETIVPGMPGNLKALLAMKRVGEAAQLYLEGAPSVGKGDAYVPYRIEDGKAVFDKVKWGTAPLND